MTERPDSPRSHDDTIAIRRLMALVATVLVIGLVALIAHACRGTSIKGPTNKATTTVAVPPSSPRSEGEPRERVSLAPEQSLTASPIQHEVDVRDMADGSPCAALALYTEGHEPPPGRHGKEAVTWVGPGVVRLSVPIIHEKRVHAVAPFHVLGWTESESGRSTIWVYRDLTIEGRVVVPDIPDLTPHVRVEGLVLPGGVGIRPSQVPEPWSQKWLSETGRFPWRTRARVERDGKFTVSVPRIKGLILHARGPSDKLEPVVRRIETSQSLESGWEDLALRPVRTVAGRVIWPDTAEAKRARVTATLFIGQTGALSDRDVALLNFTGGQGVTGTGRTTDSPSSQFTFITSESAAEDGSFEVPFYEPGRAMLLIEASGCLNEELELGEITAARTDVVVHLREAVAWTSLRLVRGGTPIAGGTVRVIDGGQAVGQSIYGPYAVREDGTCDIRAARLGRDYYLIVTLLPESHGGVSELRKGWITWSGQMQIDLENDLASNRDE